MSWYTATVPHNRIPRDVVVWLEDTPDVQRRLEKGLLELADEPDWYRQMPEDRRWNSTTTEPSQ